MNIISGEKLQNYCDIFIGYSSFFDYNPFIKKLKEKHYNIENIKEKYDNPKKVFCYIHMLREKNFPILLKVLNEFENYFILIFHNEDTCFNEKHCILFDKIPKLIHIFTQNMDVNHSKVTPIPIGIANNMWKHGNLNILENVINKDIEKINNIFFNFCISTNKNKRSICYDKISKLKIPFLRNTDYKTYLEKLKSYKFCICPEGNGIDCHRFWECLYLKVIPICEKNILVEYYSKFFPIIILNDWNDLDIKSLKYENYKWENEKMLDIEWYYKNFDSIL